MIINGSLHTDRPAVPVLYLDLDGTVREGKDDDLGKFVNGPEDVRVFPEAVLLMKAWKKSGGRIIGVSNQGGIALGLVSEQQVYAAMQETDHQCGHVFDRIAWCVHHPNAARLDQARCWCRKPGSGLVIETAIDLAQQYQEIYPPWMSLFVGDREEDRLCAERVSIDFQWANAWRALAVRL
jgi:D-glycero-D-manno-heptose 1,7-bisphosphate phosphatase